MDLQKLYEHIKDALPAMGLRFSDMHKVKVHQNGKGLVLTHGAIAVQIGLPKKETTNAAR